jgi:hypothetical protein
MAAARQKEMNESMTVLATTTLVAVEREASVLGRDPTAPA